MKFRNISTYLNINTPQIEIPLYPHLYFFLVVGLKARNPRYGCGRLLYLKCMAEIVGNNVLATPRDSCVKGHHVYRSGASGTSLYYKKEAAKTHSLMELQLFMFVRV